MQIEELAERKSRNSKKSRGLEAREVFAPLSAIPNHTQSTLLSKKGGTTMELSDSDRLVVIDELTIRLSDAEKANESIKDAGWSGSGVVGFEITRLKEIIAKLKSRK